MVFLNKQNKKHFALFRQQDDLSWRNEYLSWTDILFDKRAQELNKKLNKVSPRRGKTRAREELNELLIKEPVNEFYVEQLFEMIEEDESILD